MSKKLNERLFFIGLFLIVIILFHKAFSIGFFQDDYFFLHISHAKNLHDILNFFNPIRTYSFKPLASEVFYFILGLTGYNLLIGHTIVFLTYFAGLFFLYRILKDLFKKEGFAMLAVFIYAIHFSHVFQLYWFATYQEVVVFAALTGSFWFYLRKRYGISILFFIAALLSKETATLYAPFLIVFELARQRTLWPKNKRFLALYTGLAGVAYLILRYSLKYVTALDNYKIQPTNIKLFLNNSMWHVLWSLGAPNFMSDVLKSVFAPPLPEFYKYLKNSDFVWYLYLFGAYLLCFLIYLIFLFIQSPKVIVKLLQLAGFCLISFFLFLGPILFFPHKWMVRLTIPHIFIALLLSYALWQGIEKKGVLRIFACLTIVLFCAGTIFGVRLHESSSVYLLENRFYQNISTYMNAHKSAILQTDGIYFKDSSKKAAQTYWGQSMKLKSSLWDQYFLTYYFPEKPLKAYYSFETKIKPKNMYVIPSYLLLQ